MTQVSEAYQNLARSLQTGMKGLGEAHIGGAKMGLLEAQTEAELTDPRRMLAQEQATMELQKKSIPYNITTVAGDDINAFENLIALPNKADPNTTVIDIFPRQLGFTEMRVDEDGTTRYYKPGTNEFCNMLHLEANQETFTKIMAANFNRFKHYRAVLENPVDESQVADAKDFLSNPARQVRELAMDAEKLRNWGMESAANGIYKLIGVIQKNMQLEISGRTAGIVKIGTRREVKRGEGIITEEWNGTEWVQVAKAPRWDPKAGRMEDRFYVSQELSVLKQDKRTLKRDISEIKAFPDLDYYKPQKERLPILEQELKDINARIDELLGKKTEKKDPLGIR